jgi:myo-inositol-1(or 4)-monophosphatase
MISDAQLQEFLHEATDLAHRGGLLAKSLVGKTACSRKSDKSVVTEADKRVQDLIVEKITRRYPTHGLIAEETTDLAQSRPRGDADFVWSIDPIDGTRNYASGVSVYCCSVALLYQGTPIVGAIYEPNVDWLFCASANTATTLNGQPVNVKQRPFAHETVLAFTIGTYAKRPAYLHQLMDRCTMRNTGSAALQLGMAAAGMVDLTLNVSVKLWDIAAGALIVERAGGTVWPIDQNNHLLEKPFWPMDLKNYTDTLIPLAAGGQPQMSDLKLIMENL